MASSTCLMLPARTTQYLRSSSHLCLRLETLNFSSRGDIPGVRRGVGRGPRTDVPHPTLPSPGRLCLTCPGPT